MTRLLYAAVAMLAVTSLTCAETNAELNEQVRKTEIAFAETMVDRDLAACAAFLTDDSVFMPNGKPSRGSSEIVAARKLLFEVASAPFSWEPQLC